MKYPKPIASDPYTYSVVRVNDDEEAMIVIAFLSWKRTWNHNGFGLDISYQAAKDTLKRHKMKVDEYIDILYRIKEAWTGAMQWKKN